MQAKKPQGGTKRVPKLCRHRATNRGYVTNPETSLEVYFGDRDSPECPIAYDRWCSEFLARRAAGPIKSKSNSASPDTVGDLVVDFLRWADGYYRKAGVRTSEYDTLRSALTPLTETFRDLPASEFGPLALRALREQFLLKGWARGYINEQVQRVRRLFRWGVAEQRIEASVLVALRTLAPLEKGRKVQAGERSITPRESEKVQPVAIDDFWAAVEELRPALRTLCRVHYLLGCRAGEIVAMRPCDLERESEPWTWWPAGHKTEHRGRDRWIPVGREARALLSPLFEHRRPKAWVFPSKGVGRHLGHDGHLTVSGYRRAIEGACRRAKVPAWCPLQLRHTRLTEIRRRYGIEGAQVIGGHAELTTSQIYAEADYALARKVAEEMG